jgi:hypothetical protein
VTVAREHDYNTDILDTLAQRVVVGATSTTGVDAVETKYVRLQSC